MKKFYTILFSGISLVLCTAVLIFGVLSLTKSSFSLNNNIIFNPTSIYVNVNAYVEGFSKSGLSQETLTDLDNKIFQTDDVLNPEESLGEWNIPTLSFQSKETPIVFTFNIINTGDIDMEVKIFIKKPGSSNEKIELTTTNPQITDKLKKSVEKYERVGSDFLGPRDNPDLRDIEACRIRDDRPLIVKPNDYATIRYVVMVNPECKETFKNEDNSFELRFDMVENQ